MAAAVAELAAAVADEAALVADVVAEAASTIKFQAEELVLVVKGCDPLDVCAETHIKILFVDVSFTKSLTLYERPAAQSPLYTPNSCTTLNSPLSSKPNTLFALAAAFSVISKLPIVLVSENLIDLSSSVCCC